MSLPALEQLAQQAPTLPLRLQDLLHDLLAGVAALVRQVLPLELVLLRRVLLPSRLDVLECGGDLLAGVEQGARGLGADVEVHPAQLLAVLPKVVELEEYGLVQKRVIEHRGGVVRHHGVGHEVEVLD